MATNTPLEIVEYYQDLLIMQYLGLPKASGTIRNLISPAIIPQTSMQTIIFSPPPSAGTFVLSYEGNDSAAINWSDTSTSIQTKLQAITGLSSVTVSGSIITSLVVTFVGVIPPASLLTVLSNSLTAISGIVGIDITENDITLPLAVQDGFNLVSGTQIAVGDQLDILGKYVGVSRSGSGFTAPIVLNDADFLSLIRMAISKNSSGSSLSIIQAFLNQYFPGQIFVFDYQNMSMSYIIAQSVGSQELAQLFVTEGVLPKPMGVQLTVFYVPFANLFSFRTYEHAAVNASPFNTYDSYQINWPFLTYGYLVANGSLVYYSSFSDFFSFRTYDAPSSLAPMNDYSVYVTTWPFKNYSN